jgi:hypothetical protein
LERNGGAGRGHVDPRQGPDDDEGTDDALVEHGVVIVSAGGVPVHDGKEGGLEAGHVGNELPLRQGGGHQGRWGEGHVVEVRHGRDCDPPRQRPQNGRLEGFQTLGVVEASGGALAR